MSWFEKAKTVLIEALDIQDDDRDKAAEKDGVTAGSGGGGGSGGSSDTGATSSGAALVSQTTSSDTPTFFDNPHANEMVTIPPRASDPAVTTPTPTSTSAAMGMGNPYAKRHSATSDSVDLLSSPSPTSPEGDAASAMENSESSLELITATTASEMEMSPDTEPSLPGSIVIIASNETSDNAEGDGEDDDDDDDGTQLERHLEDHLNDSTKTMKALVFSDTQAAANVTGADSDSTQSFEDIQMQMSHKDKAGGKGQGQDGEGEAKAEVVDQSYSSTSSDIEIISNPNGDSSTNSTTTRTSPQKFKELGSSSSRSGAGTGTGLTGQVLKPKGHHREPSEISLLSEDSQSELDKLVNRISELNQVIEAREQRLLQSERQNAELLERNQELRASVEAAANSANSPDAAEAVQRLSALEKKFQTSIRERDALRIQIKSLKDELLNKIPKDELAECNEMIAALQSEGEKLSKEILQQSIIIKKLRAKEKTSDTLLKKNGEQISLLSSESERLKKSLAAKEEMERTQIEAVGRMTHEKRRVDEENADCRSRVEDLQSKLSALQSSFDGVRGDLVKRTRVEQDSLRAENQEYVQQLGDMREKLRHAEHSLAKREQQLREENRQLLRRLEAAELRAESSTQELSVTTTPLIRQIESLQKTLNQRTASWNKEEQLLIQRADDAQLQLRSVQQLESVQNEKQELLRTRCSLLEAKLSSALAEVESARMALSQLEHDASLKESSHSRKLATLQEQLQAHQERIVGLEEQQQCQQRQQQQKADAEAERETLQRQPMPSLLTVEAVKASSEMQPHKSPVHSPHSALRQHSPPLSLADESGSTEDAMMGGIIDWQTDDLDCASNSGRNQSGIIQGVHLSFMAGNTTTLEHLQSLLKQRDGELTHLQWELSRLQAERGVLDGEISHLTIELETMKEKMQSYEAMEKCYEDLQHRYDALLQMYGEKVERTEELELDLVELKSAYKLQIDELLANPPPNLQRPAKHT
ncbi:TATA element modulatory factor [Drosophila obscura]|uniref:TATA element modulatory factor n=1 Tax=Drosophila obscura TaxID=7282 RepID=UPI001BB17C8F|nr:TATA element modulatory factor [Drosophila obscura]XP_022223485.2 TATA element modulatory factor [Drosophila obscura]